MNIDNSFQYQEKTEEKLSKYIKVRCSQAADISKIQLTGFDNNDRIVKIHFKGGVVVPQASRISSTAERMADKYLNQYAFS